MTTCREWPATDAVRAWAAEQLGVAPSASRAECRAALLRALPDDDFVPFESTKPAAQLLLSAANAAASGNARQHYLRDSEDALRRRIETFAAEFFSLEPGERRQRYEELLPLTAALPALQSRLKRLERGLDIERNPTENMLPGFSELGSNICELFTLPPLASIARRQELQARWSLDPALWQGLAIGLSRLAPKLAALQEPVLERLRVSMKMQEARARKRAARVRTVVATTTSGDTPKPGRYAWLIVGVVIGILKLIISAGNHRDSTPTYNPPPYNPPPNFRLPDVQRNWPQAEKDIGFKDWPRRVDKDRDVKLPDDLQKVLDDMRRRRQVDWKKNLGEGGKRVPIDGAEKRAPTNPPEKVEPINPLPKRPEGPAP